MFSQIGNFPAFEGYIGAAPSEFYLEFLLSIFPVDDPSDMLLLFDHNVQEAPYSSL